MKLNNIKNFVQLTDTIGTAGQPTASQFSEIAAAEYRYVVNLGLSNHPNAVPEEDRLLSEFGIGYIHIPVKFDAPSKVQVKLFCDVMHALKGQKVFVHCIMNFRASAFMYHYLTKVEKMTDAKARSIMFDYWDLEPAWVELMSWSAEDIGLL